MKKILVVIIAATATTILAAGLRLGSELPLSSAAISIGPAAHDQNGARIAASNSGFLAVWIDDRQQLGRNAVLYATVLDANGTALELFGHPIARVAQAVTSPVALASNGDGYLVAYSINGSTYALPLDASGYQSGEPQLVSTSVPVEITSNGETYLLATRPGYAADRFFALDRTGRTLRVIDARFFTAAGGIGVHDGAYVVAGTDTNGCASPCTNAPIAIMTIGNNDFSVRPFAAFSFLGTSAAFTDDAVLIASDSSPAKYLISGYDGALRAGPEPLPLRAVEGAATDGREFLVSGRGEGGTLRAVRVSVAGRIRDALPFLISANQRERPRFATQAGATVMVAAEKQSAGMWDIYSRARSFADLAAGTMPKLVSRSASAQRDPSIDVQSSIFGAWTEDGETRIVGTSLGGVWLGPTVRVAPGGSAYSGPSYWSPRVVKGRTTYLVVWTDDAGSVAAQRYGLDGRIMDLTPITIATNTLGYQYYASADVGWNGDVYLVVWGAKSLFGRYVTEGAVMDSGPTVMATHFGYLEKPSVAANGHDFEIVASSRHYVICDPASCPPPTIIQTTHVSGTTISTSTVVDHSLSHGDGSSVGNVSQAITDDRVSIVWSEYRPSATGWSQFTVVPCIGALQISTRGESLREPRLLRCFDPLTVPYAADPPPAPPVAIVWNGTEHVLAWSHDGAVYAMRFDRELNAIDTQATLVTTNATDSRIDLKPTVNGAIIAYARIDRAAGDVPRVFTRELVRDDTPAPPRRRSVRQ